jgi:hypothetical protein
MVCTSRFTKRNNRSHKESSVGNESSPDDEVSGEPVVDGASEGKLRGAALNGSEQKAAADHSEYETGRNPDTELRLDGEADTLYGDGIEIEEEFDTPAGTEGSSATIP